jgi:hypothetical protein
LRQKSGEVVIEPPGNLRRGGVLEVNNGILVTGKLAFVKKRACSMDQPVILIFGTSVDALAMKAGEERSRTCTVKTLVVIKDANPQELTSSWAEMCNSRNC